MMDKEEIGAWCVAISLLFIGLAIGAMWMNVYDTTAFKFHGNMQICAHMENGTYAVYYYGTGEMRIRDENATVICQSTGWGT
jgi:H+/Cl- antiporter ClcA